MRGMTRDPRRTGKPRVYRDHIAGFGHAWRYTHPVDDKSTTGLRLTWREALDGLRQSMALTASGWRP